MFGLSSREILVITLSGFGFAAAFLLQDQFELKLTTVIIFVCAGGSPQFSTILPINMPDTVAAVSPNISSGAWERSR